MMIVRCDNEGHSAAERGLNLPLYHDDLLDQIISCSVLAACWPPNITLLIIEDG